MIKKPETCRPCILWEGGQWCGPNGFSLLEGDGSSGLMVIAEALGRNEEKKGLPLRPDAKAGGVYQKALDVGKLSRGAATITNLVRCRPPGNELKGMPYERAAIDHCRQYLDAAIAERSPRLLLALGDVPLRELSLVGGTISELRGYVLPSRYSIPMIATYHPSHLARGAFGQLFGVFLHDIRTAYKFAQYGVPDKLETNYVLDPTDDDIRNYLDYLRSGVPVAYDIETPGILGTKEPDDWREKKIIQIQFSSGVGEAIVFPWTERHVEPVKEVMATSNLKMGWNNRLSDRPCLKANGVTINGEDHDLMNAFAHLQPNFVSGKDASDTEDKGVPARLMSLQSCVSFYYPYEGVWKGMVQEAVKEAVTQYSWVCLNNNEQENDAERYLHTITNPRVQRVLKYYGARDADMTFRVGIKIFASLKKLGLW